MPANIKSMKNLKEVWYSPHDLATLPKERLEVGTQDSRKATKDHELKVSLVIEAKESANIRQKMKIGT